MSVHSKGTGSKNAIDSAINSTITRLVLSQSLILTPFFVRAVLSADIANGFKKAGVYPVNCDAVKVFDYDVQHTGEADDADNVCGQNNPGTRNACFL